MRQMTLAGALAAVTLLFLFAGSTPAHAAFTPSYTMTIDDNAMPNEGVTLPSTDNCATLAPCEMYQTTSIPAGQPLGRADTSIPRPKFTIADGFPITNGTVVGAFGFDVGIIIAAMCLPGFINVPYPAVTLVDAALPSYLAGPWAGDSNGGASEPNEQSGPTSPSDPTKWSINLESDPNANALWVANDKLIARYVGIIPVPGLQAVNILVFESLSAYITTMIVGDPLAPPPGVTFCTPFRTSTDFLGSTNLGVPLRQCNVPGADQVTATFTPTVGAAVNVSDAVNCSGALPTVSESAGNFCIVGPSTGIGWDWRIFFTTGPTANGTSSIGGSVAAQTSGDPATVLATAWANSLNDPPAVVAATVPGLPHCFHADLDTAPPTNATSPSSYFLFVSTGGGLECHITPSGCSFNPIVYYVPPGASPVGGAVALAVSDAGSRLPVIPLAASAVGAVALLAAGLWYGRRRWLR